jgi:4'-phosphopantetheinyl transferase
MGQLTPREIHLWFASCADVTEADLQARYRALLSEEELRQAGCFLFERDRRRYLATRGLLRTVLSRYLPVVPAAWSFFAGSYGRPQIANPEAIPSGLTFNVSHTADMIVVAIACCTAVGIDIENCSARKISLPVARRLLAPAEVADLARAPPQNQQQRFFEYWTLKEAYAKARGFGLLLPLDKFSFDCSADGSVAFAIDAELEDDASHWRFWQFRPVRHHSMALCAGGAGAQLPDTVKAVQMSGGGRVRPIGLRVLRTSAR